MLNTLEMLTACVEYIYALLPHLNILKVVTYIYLIIFIMLLFLTLFGRQLGLRRKYIQILLKVFEFGCSRIKKKREKEKLKRVSETDEEETPICMSDNESRSYFSWDQTSDISWKKQKERYHLKDMFPYVTAGISAIVQDDVIPQFVSEELPYWNLLARTNNKAYEFVSVRLTVFWVIGFIIRYCILLPVRLVNLMIGMIIFFSCTIFVGPFPDGPFKRKLNSKICVSCFDIVGAGCLSLVANFHNSENIPKSGIAVANHTSPIDSMLLATDNCYDMVGQKHGGLLGFFMTLLSRSSYHIWFDRAESRDRAQVTKRLREHAANPDFPPILIFPEGVCVNNTSVMQFKKGAFEVVDEIHPIAIKFDPRFGDAFWWQDHFFSYVLGMMTSWAIVCDVWYLPVMRRTQNESAMSFANRVKAAIARKGGLSNVSWDGFLKTAPVKAEWKQKHQVAFAQQLLSSEHHEENVSVETT